MVSNLDLMNMKKSLSLLLFSLLLVILSCTRVIAQNWDIDLLKLINPRYPNSSYWKTTSTSAYYVPGVVVLGTFITGLASDNDYLKHNAYESLMNIGVATAITSVIKVAVNRERPADRYPDQVFVTSPLH